MLFGKLKSNLSAGDHSASLGNLDNTDDKLTPDALSLMKRLAKTSSPKIRPLKPRQGFVTSDSYVLFAPSLLVRDIALNSTFTQANREARARGKLNPLFAGANYIWDNIAIYEVEDIDIDAGAGAGGIDVAPCFLCGAQAIGFAVAKRPQSIEEEFDYKDKQGVASAQCFNIDNMSFGSVSGGSVYHEVHGTATCMYSVVSDT